jgi:hypothetical protein
MEIPREIYFIFFGGILTMLIDVYLSSTSYTLLFLTFIRILALFIAFFSRIIFDNDEKNIKKFVWNRFKNIFVVIATIEQAFVIYYLKFSVNIWSILYLIEQVSMPLFIYLWIRRIERENFTVLQHVWLEIVDSKINFGKSIFIDLLAKKGLEKIEIFVLQFNFKIKLTCKCSACA